MQILAPNTITLAGDTYRISPLLSETFKDLDRWIALDPDGRWHAGDGGVTGEWIRNSPSLFLRQQIAGPYLWQVRVTRLRTNASFLERFGASKHTQGASPEAFYNFNFWLRADAPGGGDFLRQYPLHLGTGWNGMGDDHWQSLFCTVVRQGDKSWSRLRRSPGYEMVVDTALPAEARYDEPHEYTFVMGEDFVKGYCDGRKFMDLAGPTPQRGHIGLCVWMCKVHFDNLRLFTLVD
jgi:hypothetical protein